MTYNVFGKTLSLTQSISDKFSEFYTAVFCSLVLKRSRMSMLFSDNNCFTQRNSAVFVPALDANIA